MKKFFLSASVCHDVIFAKKKWSKVSSTGSCENIDLAFTMQR